MKKLLVLMLTLGLVSLAGAALAQQTAPPITVAPTRTPATPVSR